MNDLLAALLLGIIEGITEFLPISSTGHLLIAEHWLGHRSDLFNIAIQAGAILAVVLIYWQRLWSLLVGFAQKNNRDYALKLMLAFAVTGALGIVVKKLGFELPETIAPIAWALLIGGFVILGVEAIDARRPDLPDDDPNAIGWGTAVLVGLAQVLAGVFPGTSRSAAAIFAALLFGRSSRLAATEFAFLVGIPTMFAATGYELLDMVRDGSVAGEDWTALTVAFVASAITAFVAVKWLLHYIQTHRFTIFAWYRIAFGALLLAWLHFGAGGTAPPAHATTEGAAPAAAHHAATTRPSPSPATTHATPATEPPAPATMPATRGTPADDPAVAALLREYAELESCGWARHERAMWLSERMEQVAVANMAAAVPHQAQNRAHWQERLDRMERDERRCAGMEHRLVDGSSYALALRAADAGSEQAAECFVAANFPVPPSMHRDPRALAMWRLDAARLIDRGIAQGNWSMVRAAANVYAPREALPEPEFAAPAYETDGTLTQSIGGPEGDYAMSYRIQRLLALGAASSEERASARAWADEFGRRLSAQQRRIADEWASGAFRSQFRGQAMREEDDGLCAPPA